MTSSGRMLRSEKGKTSPSFLIAVVIVVVGVLGVVGWRYLKPDPFKQSEMVVRESGRAFRTELADFERDILEVLKKPGLDSAARIVALETKANEVKAEIDDQLDQARAKLTELDIPLKTHQNRADRVAKKADEAKAIVDDRVDEKREQLKDG